MEIRCAVQPYAWGKLGHNSEVASLQECAHPDFCIEETKPYAELWMGAHTSAPSLIKGSNEKLNEWISRNPEVLGENVREKFGDELPFLFKVLSVNKALSIQAHPNKEHAEKLHCERPDLYKDPNHKPELAIALTPFEALCGFRPIQQIKDFLGNIPELGAIIGEAGSNLQTSDEAGIQTALRQCFKALMTCPAESVRAQLSSLVERHSSLDESSRSLELAGLVSRLASEFPGDVGCFCVYFLNYLTLKPGEALYLGPNEPHAYLSGDCIECMACSDNVVRAGLTPKYMDVDTLCQMLTYHCEEADNKKFLPTRLDSYSQLFSPPVPDFAVAKIEIPGEVANYTVGPRSSASIILAVSGQGCSQQDLQIRRGSVIFIPVGQELSISTYGYKDPLLLFQAMANV
ncbi:mannose-6-phosphate isomerase [Thrips palmi]|uniref:Mannose-6-phosphate isomerase n=1 Tax=Thrips palmi TaxID=161013 RepID=A0A6P8ZX51_THRPL|nr:mannose-6-phosphate isomerase [Thrips palmi]XP_034249978.1 mannose-6-phosphate isomerase [Thrips palmi]